jgi:hypothetical protein
MAAVHQRVSSLQRITEELLVGFGLERIRLDAGVIGDPRSLPKVYLCCDPRHTSFVTTVTAVEAGRDYLSVIEIDWPRPEGWSARRGGEKMTTRTRQFVVASAFAATNLIPDCTVVDHVPNADGTRKDVALPHCGLTGVAPPCWMLAADPAVCVSGRLVRISRAAPAPAGLTTTVTCKTCPPTGGPAVCTN